MPDYHINIFYSELEKGYVADIPDLAGCRASGDNPGEALAKVEQEKERWLEAARADQRNIPMPQYRPNIYDSPRVSGPGEPSEAVIVGAGQPSFEGDLEYIKGKIAEHQCILFLGSAVHSTPPPELTQYNYPEEKAPPIGNQLSKYLAQKAKYPGEDWWNLQRVAQHYEKENQRFGLVETTTELVTKDREPSPILRMLADMEFPIVITTNYDHLYEQALEQKAVAEGAAETEKTYDVSVYSPNKKKKSKTIDCSNAPTPKRPYILKIHGDVDKPESIVLTDEDYIQFVLRMSDKHPFNPFGNNVLAHLTKWSTLFVGYSLMDYNLRLLFKTLRWKLDEASIPRTFSVDKKPDDLIRYFWESKQDYVNFIVLNLWDCIPKLHAELGKEPLL